MNLFTTLYNDARLLGHFLRHYDNAGVKRFFIAVSSELADKLDQFRDAYHITPMVGLDVADSVMGGTAAVTEMRRIHQKEDEWVVIVYLDEFVDFREPVEAICRLRTAKMPMLSEA